MSDKENTEIVVFFENAHHRRHRDQCHHTWLQGRARCLIVFVCKKSTVGKALRWLDNTEDLVPSTDAILINFYLPKDEKHQLIGAGEEPFMTKDVKEDLSFIKWSLQYYEATGFTLYTYKSESSMPRTHDIDFESDGTIKLWFHTTYNSYYTLKKVK